MIPIESLASYVCYYGGKTYDELEKFEEENLSFYQSTHEEKYLNTANKFNALKQMKKDGVEFIIHETTSSFYYEPKEGWNILAHYVDEERIH